MSAGLAQRCVSSHAQGHVSWLHARTATRFGRSITGAVTVDPYEVVLNPSGPRSGPEPGSFRVAPATRNVPGRTSGP